MSENDYKIDAENLVIYPKNKDIYINSSDLELKLVDFKNAIKNSFDIINLISIISLWVPVFTSEFKQINGIDPNILKGMYILVVFVISLLILKSFLKNIFIFLVNYIPKLKTKFKIYIDKNTTNPKEKVENIKNSNNSTN